MKRIPSLTLAALSALALSAPRAHAQTLTLQSGDTVTVTGAGTKGTYQGQPISSSTSAYSTSTNSGNDVSVPVGAAFTLGSGALLSGGPPLGSAVVGILVQGGTATVTGGLVNGGQYYGSGLQVNTGTATVTGGTFTGSTAINAGNGLVRVSGGTINGQFRGFSIGTAGIIDLFGTFTDGSGNPLTAPIVGGYTQGPIQGTFSNGDTLSKATYAVNSGGILEFNVGPVPAPEPSPLAALAIGILSLGALTLRARKRHAA